MNIEKAIEILRYFNGEGPVPHPQDSIDAINLGIEALKRVDFSRRDPNRPSEIPMPGEDTK